MVERFERFTYTISEISRYWHRLTADEMEKYGLKGSHSVYLLALLHHPDGITAPQICEICGKDKADVSRMMSIMGRKGLVLKQGIHQNLYRGVFKLTEEGKKAAEFVEKRVTLAVELAEKGLTEDTRKTFYEVLETITANLRKLSEQGLPEQNLRDEENVD